MISIRLCNLRADIVQCHNNMITVRDETKKRNTGQSMYIERNRNRRRIFAILSQLVVFCLLGFFSFLSFFFVFFFVCCFAFFSFSFFSFFSGDCIL